MRTIGVLTLLVVAACGGAPNDHAAMSATGTDPQCQFFQDIANSAGLERGYFFASCKAAPDAQDAGSCADPIVGTASQGDVLVACCCVHTMTRPPMGPPPPAPPDGFPPPAWCTPPSDALRAECLTVDNDAPGYCARVGTLPSHGHTCTAGHPGADFQDASVPSLTDPGLGTTCTVGPTLTQRGCESIEFVCCN